MKITPLVPGAERETSEDPPPLRLRTRTFPEEARRPKQVLRLKDYLCPDGRQPALGPLPEAPSTYEGRRTLASEVSGSDRAFPGSPLFFQDLLDLL